MVSAAKGSAERVGSAECSSVEAVLAHLRNGGELHRIASERDGHYWVLMPGVELVPPEIAEVVASEPGVVTAGARVGRVSWKFEDREVAQARLLEQAAASTR